MRAVVAEEVGEGGSSDILVPSIINYMYLSPL